MTTKLISLNIGCHLIVQDEQGNQHAYEWSAICPSKGVPQPCDIMYYLNVFLESHLERDIQQEIIPIAKPSKLKPVKQISHKTFNRNIKKKLKELGY